MTVITWADFPEIKDSKRGQEPAVVVAEMFLPSTYAKDMDWFRQHAQKVAKIGALSGLIWLGSEYLVFAETLDQKARNVYYGKFVKIAIWVIAIKGGWDTIHKALKEDFEGAKRSSLQYLLIFGIIMGLPIALHYVETLFTE